VKFNMGCGRNKLPGYVNVDASAASEPDMVFDLEQMPWPWQNSSAEHVVFNHSLEHMGRDPAVFLGMMQQLYRICSDGAKVLIHVPHPRHDNYMNDPTHVRPITPGVMSLFDRELNDNWAKMGASNTPLALYTGVDFKIVKVEFVPDDHYRLMLEENRVSSAELQRMSRELNNVVVEIQLELLVIKKSEASGEPSAPEASPDTRTSGFWKSVARRSGMS
jgi:hypothetical protein